MQKSILAKYFILLSLIFFSTEFQLVAKESKIRGYYFEVGELPEKNSIEKVVFEEFINFGCTHCNKLHKASKKFRKKFSEKIEFIDIPVLFSGQDDSPLRLYYIAKKMGRGDFVKDELFKATFEHGVNVFDPGIVNFIARSIGIHKEFKKEKNKAWVNKLLKNGTNKSKVYGVTGTPTVVIQSSMKMEISRYGTMSNFIKKIPETIEDLIQK